MRDFAFIAATAFFVLAIVFAFYNRGSEKIITTLFLGVAALLDDIWSHELAVVADGGDHAHLLERCHPDRLPKGVAAGRGGLRVLDHVHEDRDHRARPCVPWLRAVHRQRNGQPVVDIEPVEETLSHRLVSTVRHACSARDGGLVSGIALSPNKAWRR